MGAQSGQGDHRQAESDEQLGAHNGRRVLGTLPVPFSFWGGRMRLVNQIIEGFENVVVSLGLGIATLAAFVEVIARFVFNTSTGSGGELTNYSIIWAAMVGAAVAARSGVHIGVDVVVKQMPPTLAKAVVLLGLLVSAVFTLIVTWLGIDLVQFS